MYSNARIAGTVSLIVLSAAAGFGCGGGGETTSLSGSAFVTRTDEICRQAQAEFDQIQRTTASTPEAAESQVDALIGVSSQALDDLRQITPPAELQPRYVQYLAARERALGFLEDGRDAAGDRDAPAYLRAKRRASAEQETRLQLARGLGLDACGRPGRGA
jgi:protein-tyrosine-phosphatase